MSKQPNERTKVVVRGLPPTLTEQAFQEAVDKVVASRYNWFSYYGGKVSLKRTVQSKAFINFDNPSDVLEFKAKFDGHVFISNRGQQFQSNVEYAPFQKVPTLSTKKAPMEGTIEKDADYQAFLKQLEEGPTALPSATAQLEQAESQAKGSGEPEPVVTSLMAFLREKYASKPFKRGSKPRRGVPVIVEEALDGGEISASASGPSSTPSKGGKKGSGKRGRGNRGEAPEDAAGTAGKNQPVGTSRGKPGLSGAGVSSKQESGDKVPSSSRGSKGGEGAGDKKGRGEPKKGGKGTEEADVGLAAAAAAAAVAAVAGSGKVRGRGGREKESVDGADPQPQQQPTTPNKGPKHKQKAAGQGTAKGEEASGNSGEATRGRSSSSKGGSKGSGKSQGTTAAEAAVGPKVLVGGGGGKDAAVAGIAAAPAVGGGVSKEQQQEGEVQGKDGTKPRRVRQGHQVYMPGGAAGRLFAAAITKAGAADAAGHGEASNSSSTTKEAPTASSSSSRRSAAGKGAIKGDAAAAAVPTGVVDGGSSGSSKRASGGKGKHSSSGKAGGSG